MLYTPASFSACGDRVDEESFKIDDVERLMAKLEILSFRSKGLDVIGSGNYKALRL